MHQSIPVAVDVVVVVALWKLPWEPFQIAVEFRPQNPAMAGTIVETAIVALLDETDLLAMVGSG